MTDKKTKKDKTDKGESKLKKVPRRKIIYVAIDDEITAIYDQMRGLKIKDVYLMIPQRAVILQSVVNLRILKRKAEDLEKNLFLITRDSKGVHLAKQAKIPVYDQISNKKVTTKMDSEIKIAPLMADSNEIKEELPRRISEKKVSILDLTQKRKKKEKKMKPIKLLKLLGKSKKKESKYIKKENEISQEREEKKITLALPSRRTIATLISISVLVLLVISYVALPGATIYLTPRSNVLKKSVNITFADSTWNSSELSTHPLHMLASYPVKANITKTLEYSSTGNIFRGENASGEIEIFNKSPNDWPLIPRTRFQNKEGLVFRIKHFVTVPKNGSVKVTVYADSEDAYGRVVGDKGNIGPTKFFLPGLRASNQKVLYAESKIAMTGGKTIVIKKVRKEDLEAAEKKIKQIVEEAAREELEKMVAKRNKEEGSNFFLVNSPYAITRGKIKIELAKNLLDQERETFTISAEGSTEGIIYNHREFLNVLKTELKLSKNPEKSLTNIDDKSVNYKVIDLNPKRKKVKITATIKGVEEYEVNPESENGIRLIKKIKEHILGKDIEEAKNLIQNLPEINKVDITLWPVWSHRIPSVASNVKVEVVRD